MNRLTYWLPQSLFARLLAALVGVVGITLVVIVLLIVRERRDLALWGSSAWSAAAVIADTSEQLAKLDGAARRAALEKYQAEPIELENSRRSPPPQIGRAIAQSQQAFLRRLRHQLDHAFSVSIERPTSRANKPIRIIEEPRRSRELGGPRAALAQIDRELTEPQTRAPTDSAEPPGSSGPAPGVRADQDTTPAGNGRRVGMTRGRMVDIAVTLPDGERVIFRTNIPALPPLPRPIFAEIGVLTLALALVLFLMTRNIVKPLSELARAADAIGKGAKVPPLPERGARELRDATRAFNTMQDRLHRYLDSRTRVLAAMSHDLRTPLTRMRLRAETIDDTTTRERLTADIDEMSGMVTGALALFKGLNDSEVAAPTRIDDILLALQQEFAEMGGEVMLSAPSGTTLLVKPNAIKRCLSNLLHNAVKYGERARVQIASVGARLQISIRDDGPGIPEELLEQVFEPFYRVESSRNRDSGGTGLGLCIARDIAAAHGGSIQLRNVPGGGLEALLSLPRVSGEW